jgi:hypothetical protein
MPVKAKATYESVRDAVNQLEKEGKDVNPTNVLNLTGGSRSTVYKFLNQLQDEDTKRQIKKPLPELEDIINEQSTAIITNLYEICKHRAEEVVLTEYESMKQRFADLQKTAAQMDLIEERYQLKAQNFELQEQKLKAENQELKEQNKLLKEQVQTLKEQITALNKMILKQ